MPIAIDARDPVDLEMEVERAELADLVDRALRALPQTSREVMRRRYLDDLSIGEIAERSGSSPDAISMRLTRGKAALRRLLAGEMRDDAESLGLVPPDVGRWTPTRVPCTQCGLGTLLMRIEPPPGAIAFRCARCDPSPSALAIVYPLSSPDFARLLHGLVRPTAILRRADAWSHAYYAGGMESGAVPCARCGATVPLRTYERDDVPAGIARRGLYADCAVCGLQISSSVSALTLVQPQARAFRRSHPRVRSMPSRDIESRGRPAVVVGYQAVGSNARLDAVFAADSLRLLEVHAPSPNAA